MPERRGHELTRQIFKLVLGEEFPDVDAWMDAPAKILGPGHRILRHDVLSVALKYNPFSRRRKDRKRFLAALAHIGVDEGTSAIRREARRRAR